MKHQRKIYYSIQNYGDGSAGPSWFDTEELAELDQELMDEGWGEPCTGWLTVESYMEMKRWIRMLNENGHIHLHVSGHADSIGSESYNQKLSERRAQAVVDYMIDNGIAEERLVAEGFGESQPVSANDTEEGRQQNRRVQVRILNSGK